MKQQATPTRAAVEARITDALVEFGTERELLRPEATLEELDIDSLDLFELGQILSHEFGIEVEVRDFEDLETVGDAQRAILSYVE